MKKRIAVLIAVLTVAGAGVLGLNWANFSQRLRPTPVPETLTLAVINTYIGSGLVHIAAAKGFFTAEGLNVSLQPYASGGLALAALREGRADLATVGSLPIVIASMNQTELSVIASIASALRGAGLVARRDRGIAMAADLRGKTIGVTQGTDGHFALGLLLAEQNIPMGQVRLQDLQPEAMVTGLASGQVDAICTWEPLLSHAREALDPAGVSIEIDRGYSIWFQLVGQRRFVRDHPVAVAKLLRALLRAEQFMAQDPVGSAAIVATATQMSTARFVALRPNFSLQVNLPQGLLNLLEDQARWAIANQYTKATQLPNFLETLYLDGLLAVKPQAVMVVR